MRDVVMFEFAGRRQNMELQLPLMRRVLAENPGAEFHIWNLARNSEDAEYIKGIRGERISVHGDFYGDNGWERFNDVYRHYADPQYKDCLFVKIDDDVVFLETGRFADFLAAVDDNRGSVVSAKVVNNGACTPTEPGLWAGFEKLNIPLLDVHLSTAYAEMSHQYFFDHDMVGQPVKLIPTEDWLSINVIGYDWPTACRIAELVGTHSPQRIAGRNFPDGLLGDEGMVNTLPRLIMQGFLACHLNFGPQVMPAAQLTDVRERYAAIGQRYLGATCTSRS